MGDSSPRGISFRIGLATFGILVLELALIRWTSQQVPVFAYFNNLTLMAAFLGMGLGVAIGVRHPALHQWTLPSLAILSIPLAFSERLGLVRLTFPDLSVMLWGSESWINAWTFVRNVGIVLLLFGTIVEIFVCAGSVVGSLFTRLPALRAYSADLLGSLLGVAAMTAVSALGTPPPVWFAIGALPFLVFSRRLLSAISVAAVIGLTFVSMGSARFSPYYRIDLSRATEFAGAPIQLSVNRNFHQYMQDLSPRALVDPKLSDADRRMVHSFEQAYRLPFSLTDRRDSALVVGAGTGNDVAGALRSGFRRVVSVDIDPMVMRIGKEMHPEHPYDNGRAVRVVNDARAYFEQNSSERFDVVCFGLLDSHAMFSAMSSLRLENYVYTIQSIRSAWRLVKPGGALTLSFSVYSGEWLSDRLYSMIRAATGIAPRIVVLPMLDARMFVVGKGAPIAQRLASFSFAQLQPTDAAASMRIPSDDWPFLYIRPGTFPAGYAAIILGLLSIAFIGARLVFGGDLFRRRNFDLPLFLMGTAFLLIETHGVVNLSLLFGSTWIVNSSVFAGILVMAWMANLWVERVAPVRLEIVFALLFAAVLLNYFVPPSLLLDLPMWGRGVAGGLVNGLPIAFAGVIFSTLFSRSETPSLSLGSNLLGALVGGCIEYLSMFTGLKALALVALILYLAVYFSLKLRYADRAAAPAEGRVQTLGRMAGLAVTAVVIIGVLGAVAATTLRGERSEEQASRRWIRANRLADAKAQLQTLDAGAAPAIAQVCEDAERIDPQAFAPVERARCVEAHVAMTRTFLSEGKTAEARRTFDRAVLELGGRMSAELSRLQSEVRMAENGKR